MSQREKDQALKVVPHLPRIRELQEQAAIASRAFTAALGSNDPRQEIETSLALADAEEAVAAYLAPLELDPPWHPAHSATIAVIHIMRAIDHLDNAVRMDNDPRRADIQADRASRIAKWCKQGKALEIECSLADRAATRGRFADALTRLARVRDEAAAAQHDAFDDFGKTEVDITFDAISTRAEILLWLGDPKRAKLELEQAQPVGVAAPTPQLDKAALLQATHAISGTSQYPWVYTNGKAFTQIGDIARPEQFEKSLQQAFKRINEYRASFRWNRLIFLCLKQLAERDPKLIPDMKHAFAEARAWHQACDELIGMRLPFDIFEPELLLASGDAHRALTKTIELADTAGHSLWNRHNAGVLLTYRARALRALCQISEAHDVASEAACALQTTGAVESEWRAWLLVAETTDSHDKRRKAFGAGMAAVEKMRLAPLGWRLDNLYLIPRLPLYQGTILLAAMDNDAATALSAIEAVKSRSLAAIIGAGSGIAPDADPELVRKHAAVDAEISRLQAAILADGASPENDQALQTYQSDRAKLAEQLRQADPRWRAMTSPDPVRPSLIIEAVAKLEAVAVDLFLHGTTLIAVLVADGSAFVSKRELSPSTLGALERLSRSLSAENPDQTAKDPMALGLALDAILPPPIVARLTKARRVLIAAHGVLHLLPWPVVPVAQGGRRLIELAEVGMLPNLACVPALADRPVGTACCAAIGAPEAGLGKKHRSVPSATRGTAAEVAALHCAAGRLVAPPAIGEAATLAAFERFRVMPQAVRGILHVTSHGLPPRTEPGDAALLLADGDLEAATIASRRINFDEVVLTACSTGFRPATEVQGVSLAGDDALGLPGALFESGASTLLVSIPLAEAGAAHRMAIGYHRARLAGEPPLAAFRTSQLALLADRAIRPYRACGFVVYGCR